MTNQVRPSVFRFPSYDLEGSLAPRRSWDAPGLLSIEDACIPSQPVEEPDVASALIAVIDQRALDLECLTRGLQLEAGSGFRFRPFAGVDAWRSVAEDHPDVSVILLAIGGKSATDDAVERTVTALIRDFPATPIMVIGDMEDPSQVVRILEYGARGYIPTSVSLGIAIQAVRLARAGGTYVPAASLISAQQHAAKETTTSAESISGLFTERQAEVADALRRGKANKIIAYELNLCESTVKVHIRNIMKKLNARNRTEVAFKINDIFAQKTSH